MERRTKIVATMSALLLIALLVSIGWYAYTSQEAGHSAVQNDERAACRNVDSESAKTHAQMILINKNQYASSSKDVMGRSTEGGFQTNYMVAGEVVMKEQTFYGETGMSETSYYLSQGKVFYLQKKNMFYKLPLHVDPQSPIIRSETKDFYLNENQELCFWYLDGKLQANDKDTFVLVQYLISNS